jgi:hypothetical protein
MRTAASFQSGGTSIWPCRRLTISKVYRLLGILKIKVLEFKILKIFKIKGFQIKIRKHAGATGALGDISAEAPPEGRRKYPRRPPPRLKRGMCLAMA